MNTDNQNTDNQNAGTHGFTRRAVIGAGAAAAAAGVMTNTGSVFAQGNGTFPLGMEYELAAVNPADPLVTIDFSGLKATLENGISWAAEQIPTVKLKSSDINGFVKAFSFVTPEGVKKIVKIPFTTQVIAAVTSAATHSLQRKDASDVLNTVLALYKVGQEFEVFTFRNGAFVGNSEKALVSGNIVFQYDYTIMTARDKEELDAELKASVRPEPVALNVSKLLATPSSGIATKSYALDKAPERLIRKRIFESKEVIHNTLVTDNGSDVASTALNVKNLLRYSAAERDAMSKGGSATEAFAPAASRISFNDVVTVAKVAAWVLAAVDEKGKLTQSAKGFSGAIGISFSC